MLAIFLSCSGPEEPPPGPPLGASSVRVWRSADLQDWAMDEGALATGFDTLGLSEHDGTLRLVGLDHARSIPRWERYLPLRVHGFELEGETWEPASWTVDDEGVVAFIDPQFVGDTLYFTARSGTSGDPAKLPTEIRSSPPPRVWLSGVGLADPAAVVFEEQHHLFVTTPKGIGWYLGDPPEEQRVFGGYAVPHALVVGEELWLVAQATEARSRVPHVARYAEGRWSAWQRLLPPGAIDNCTSPVLHLDEAGGGLLICVEELPWEGPSPGGSSPPSPEGPRPPGPPG